MNKLPKKFSTFLTIIIPLFLGSLITACGGGGGDNGGGTTPSNIIFVTSTTQDGNLGGLAGADAICNTQAAAAGLAGTYVAWLSTSAVDAKDRLGAARGWVRPDGLPFADTIAEMTAGKIFYPPNVDEFGTVVGTGIVMTGTKRDGTVNTGTCTDWTSNVTTLQGGDAVATTDIWTAFYSTNCSTPRRLYCLGTDHSEPVSPPAGTGRLAFVSSTAFPPSTGLAAADTICENDATAASLPGTYKALLATDSITAASRFTLTGSTWIRPDGVVVATLPSDLIGPKPQLSAPINLQADGTTYLGNFNVWKGADDFNTVAVGSNSCVSWTSTVANGTTQRASMTDSFSSGSLACSNTSAGRVYCLQE